jgi:Flp pilus assembly pilin Flp
MNNFKNILIALHHDEDGAGATEYIILLILIACVVISIVKLFGQTIQAKFEKANSSVQGEVDFN